MKIVQANISVGTIQDKEKFNSLLPQELAMVNQWKEENILEHLYLKEDGSGAILTFVNIDIQKAKEKISELPLLPFFENVEYILANKQF